MTKARSNSTAEAAKGDIRVGSGTNASSVLGVGTNGQALVANSGAATGLNWATPTDTTKIPLSTVTAAGDLIVGSGSGAVSRLAVGGSGTYLTSNGTTPSWGTVATGSMTSLASGTLSGALTVSGINQGYQNLYIRFRGARITPSAPQGLNGYFNSDNAGSSYSYQTVSFGSSPTWQNTNGGNQFGQLGPVFDGATNSDINIIIYDYAYTTSTYKGVQVLPGYNYDGTRQIAFWMGFWSGVNITSLTFTNNFTGGTYEVFGVK